MVLTVLFSAKCVCLRVNYFYIFATIKKCIHRKVYLPERKYCEYLQQKFHCKHSALW